MGVTEYVGYREELGGGLANMGLTDERIVRCRDCHRSIDYINHDVVSYTGDPEGTLDCLHFAQWDDYNDMPGGWLVKPDGFCAWGKGRDA